MKLIVISIIIIVNKSISQTIPTNSYLDQKNLYPDSNIIIKYQKDWQKDYFIKKIAEFNKKPLGDNKIVFLGNSITEGGHNWNERFGVNNIVNRGISGDFTEGVLARLNEIIYYQPIAVFLLIGINDIFDDHPDRKYITPSYVAKNILRIANNIQKYCKNTKIYIQTVLPTDPRKYEDIKGVLLPKFDPPLTDQINEIKLLIKEQNQNNIYKVIDLYSVFIDKRGFMNEVYTTDGVHLNDAGYQVWVEYVDEYVQPLAYDGDEAD